MRTVTETFALIDKTVPEGEVQNSAKFIVIAQEIDQLPDRFAIHHDLDLLRKDMKAMKLEIIATLGVVVVAGIAALGTLMKLL